jgi:hypothetical protein
MKKITDRSRKILSMIFRGISVSAASLILQACYGIIPPDEPYAEYGMPPSNTIQGKVASKKTQEPIFGIEVSIEGTKYLIHTREDGYFYLDGVGIQDVYTLKFKDVDENAHGGLFKEQTWTLKQNDTSNTLLIYMDLDN